MHNYQQYYLLLDDKMEKTHCDCETHEHSGVHIPLEYTAVFDQIFALICQSMLAAKCQNKSADFGQSEPTRFHTTLLSV